MSFWDTHQFFVDTARFRAEAHYLGIQTIFPYKEVTAYIKTLDKPWLDILKEDDAFEVMFEKIDETIVSRDLLDSIMELEFLEKKCGFALNDMRILDIGAGYGRLAHRLTTAYPGAFVYCTDKVPVSQEVCAKYLKFREIKRAEVVLPNELKKIGTPDLAINIHSWPECTRQEINGWLDWLVDNKVPNLFVIPHQWAIEGIYGEKDWNCEMFCIEDNRSFRPDIEAHGYVLKHYWRPLECNPRDFYLFELKL
jgi:putative sugar O-methyltransferase